QRRIKIILPARAQASLAGDDVVVGSGGAQVRRISGQGVVEDDIAGTAGGDRHHRVAIEIVRGAPVACAAGRQGDAGGIVVDFVVGDGVIGRAGNADAGAVGGAGVLGDRAVGRTDEQTRAGVVVAGVVGR